MLATRCVKVSDLRRAGGMFLVFACLGACGIGLLRADAPPVDPTPAATDQAETRQRIRAMVTGVKDVPLPVIIEALTDHHIVPWRGEARERLVAVADRIERLIEAAEIEAARMNEAGNKVENVVIEAMRDLGIEAGRPKAESGRARAAGYPDLEAVIDGTAFYIEVKTFSAATIDSTQRSFYLSPSTDFKVTRDAIHLLVAIELVPGTKGAYRAQSVRWLDLSGLRCDLKYEFNASNRDLYRRESGLVIVESARDPAAPVGSSPAPAAPAGQP